MNWRAQEQLDNLGLWQLDSRINEVIEQLGLDANAQLASLSGGWLRKSGAGRALVSSGRACRRWMSPLTTSISKPSTGWKGSRKPLKARLSLFRMTVPLSAIWRRLVDLDRGKLVTYPGNYDQHLLDKEDPAGRRTAECGT